MLLVIIRWQFTSEPQKPFLVIPDIKDIIKPLAICLLSIILFLLSSTTKEFRSNHTDSLLKMYHEKLMKVLKHHGKTESHIYDALNPYIRDKKLKQILDPDN